MSKFKFYYSIIFIILNAQLFADKIYQVPILGNSWTENNETQIIARGGLTNWSDKNTLINIYFKTTSTGNLSVSIIGKVAKGKSKLSFTLNGQIKKIELKNSNLDTIKVGEFRIEKSGYQKLSIQGIGRDAKQFADITDILLVGEVAKEKIYYAKDEFYWARRGPSVHLSYFPPDEADDVVWFYNEINVPEGEDIIGSYFMANGFGEGYFGIQVNSENERRILFSVWSPYHTDNPNDIPKDQRITLLKKGKDVHAGKFGNEGSGGQSYRQYMWKAGTIYKFLLKGIPVENNSTEYTAYFFAPEVGEWELIASFRRPKTSTYLKRHHSFLENFIPDMGQYSRKGYYQNQWICDKNNNWFEMTKARFTADNTARKESRMDYSGGAEGHRFFMKNCGFFDETTKIGEVFIREATNEKPEIDLNSLP